MLLRKGKVVSVFNVMNTYGGVRFTFSSPRHKLEVSGQFHAEAALPPGKETSVPIG
jgi:hypothetical protein